MFEERAKQSAEPVKISSPKLKPNENFKDRQNMIKRVLKTPRSDSDDDEDGIGIHAHEELYELERQAPALSTTSSKPTVLEKPDTTTKPTGPAQPPSQTSQEPDNLIAKKAEINSSVENEELSIKNLTGAQLKTILQLNRCWTLMTLPSIKNHYSSRNVKRQALQKLPQVNLFLRNPFQLIFLSQSHY